MASVAEKISECKKRSEAALAIYLMAGHPNASATKAAIRGAVRGGADIIELGYPFSDPLADGPVIQEAATISIKAGMKIDSYMRIVKFAKSVTNVPLVSMTYSNIFERHGYEKLVSKLARTGIDGIILADMPVDESADYIRTVKKHGAETIFLASPNTSKARLTRIASASTGFVYLVGVYGTTGQRRHVERYTLDAIRTAKRLVKNTPIGVGFGISTPQDVRACVRAGADAVIVGSPIVRIAGNTPQSQIEKKVATYVSSLKRATQLR